MSACAPLSCEQPLTSHPVFEGWIVTYVIDLRGGGPSSGYISSGFFGGKLFKTTTGGRIQRLLTHSLGRTNGGPPGTALGEQARRREARHLPLRHPRYRVSSHCASLPFSSLFPTQCLTICAGNRLQIVVWLVPSLIGGAVAVSFVGVLLGPMYPLVMNHARHVLPPWLLTGCIGWIAGFGQAGSAFLPFVTVALASKVGIKVLQPL